MPTFGGTAQDLFTYGPLLEVYVAPSGAALAALGAAGQAPPTPVKAIAMIDTGATRSVVQAGIPAQLGLSPVGVTTISTPSSTNVACAEYLVRLVIAGGGWVEETVIEAPLQGQHIQCLIGRDILRHGVLVYSGITNSFTLSI